MQSKKELAVLLSKLRPFTEPDPLLEQYPTDSEVAAAVLWNARMQGDVAGREIADLGCGTGVLGIGALALDAKYVTFIEIDPRVFPALMENLAMLESLTGREYGNYDIIQGNVLEHSRAADVVIENPPFGTRERGADVTFLRKAMALAPIVYSLHKSTTVGYVQGVVEREGRKVTGVERFDFPLKRTMPSHERRIQRIAVSCLRIA